MHNLIPIMKMLYSSFNKRVVSILYKKLIIFTNFRFLIIVLHTFLQ